MRTGFVMLTFVACTLLAGGCGHKAQKAPTGKFEELTGTVEKVEAEGENPAGYLLKGDHEYGRLYLKVDAELNSPRLEQYAGKKVTVQGGVMPLKEGLVEDPEVFVINAGRIVEAE